MLIKTLAAALLSAAFAAHVQAAFQGGLIVVPLVFFRED